MAVVICGIVTVAIFQLIVGLGLTGFSVVGVFATSKIGDDYDLSGLFLMVFAGLWSTSAIVAGATTLFAGIIGLVAACHRGQCVVLTYMSSCILSCLASFEAMIISALYVAYYCKDVGECSKGVAWIVILSCSLFILLISSIGSGLSCRARCFCCASEGNYGERNSNLVTLASPMANELRNTVQ